MEYIEFGKIVNTHGIKGEIKIYSYTNSPNNILTLKKVYIENVEHEIEKVRYASNMFIMKLKGIDKIEDTSSIMNKEIFREISTQELENEEEFFVRDLIGLDILDNNNKYIGKLKDIINTGANDIYIVEKEDGKELLIPAIKQVVNKIDIKEKHIIVTLMEGL